MRLEDRFREINKEKQIKFNKMSKSKKEIKEEKNHKKSELINDLMATITVMEDYWRFHPDNPEKQDVTKEYQALVKMKDDIEKELAELDKE
tara:strand:- start:3962 stop:4234 length:273 start_codon:yes stop_codon:yes gene_type:complete